MGSFYQIGMEWGGSDLARFRPITGEQFPCFAEPAGPNRVVIVDIETFPFGGRKDSVFHGDG
jgi:hypothetical protein